MRAVLTGTDFVRDIDGSFKTIEINTNIHTGVDLKYYFDLNDLERIISGTPINEVHLINKRNLRSGFTREIDITPESENMMGSDVAINLFSQMLEKFCKSKGFTFNNILLDTNSVTVPYIEDTETKLIIRIAYDVTALIDDTYARDNWEFLKLMYDSNPASIPATYIDDLELGFDSIGTILRDNGVHPNYMIKKRITPADNHIYPKLYKINSIEELNNLKSGLEFDEYVQEYILNDLDLLEGKITHYRSVDLIYGSDLDILNLWSVQFSNSFDLDNVCDLDDNNKIPIWERPKYFFKFNNGEKSPKVSADASTKVFLPDNTLTLLSSLNINDTVKSISVPDLPLDEQTYNLFDWNGSFDNLMNNFQINTTELLDLSKKEKYVGFFWNINCEDNIRFSDVSHAMILKKELKKGSETEYIVKFTQYIDLKPNDTLILFDSESNSLIEKNIVDITYSYDEIDVYGVNFEQLDLFLTSEENGLRYGLLTHNYSFDCKSITSPGIICNDCNNNAAACWQNTHCCRCGGAYPACSAANHTCYNQNNYPFFDSCQTSSPCQSAGYCNFNKSDIIHKEDIKLVGKSDNGINIYQFKYKGEDGLYEGVIGNELIGTEFENAISYNSNDGTIMVDYYKIDVQFKKLN